MICFPGTKREDIQKGNPGNILGTCIVCHSVLRAGLSGYQAEHICPPGFDAGLKSVETRLENYGALFDCQVSYGLAQKLRDGFRIINAAHTLDRTN